MTKPCTFLYGAGPTNCAGHVTLASMGMFDPVFIHSLNELKQRLRSVFKTQNPYTFPVATTGTGSWDLILANLLRPDDLCLVFNHGFFGARCVEMARQYSTNVIVEEKPFGEGFEHSQIIDTINRTRPNLVWICSLETSTGVRVPLSSDISEAVHRYGGLLVIDAVTSMGSAPLPVDDLGIDALYTCAQKCLGGPPGISAVTLSKAAVTRAMNNQSRVPFSMKLENYVSYYLSEETGETRRYFHTPPTESIMMFLAALRRVALDKTPVFEIHHDAARKVYETISALQLKTLTKDFPLIVVLHSNPSRVIMALREKYEIEVSGCLGELAGKGFRIGLLGPVNCSAMRVDYLCRALKATAGPRL